ncbi:MAG: hypothetical protein ACI9SQ_002096 [Rubritalea sp.]
MGVGSAGLGGLRVAFASELKGADRFFFVLGLFVGKAGLQGGFGGGFFVLTIWVSPFMDGSFLLE